jgi:hypothetical protein
MNDINSFLEIVKKAAITTAGQLIWLLGLVFVFGLVLYLLARMTRTTYVKSAGSKLDIIVTGWIGTPVHELGHAAFCLLFGHRITAIKLYDPDPSDGTLGYVCHSYSDTPYQKIGNFFIGIGPILFGSVVLYALLYYLIPNNSAVFSSVNVQGRALAAGGIHGDIAGTMSSLWLTAQHTLSLLFRSDNLSGWKFWVFLYLSMCVASHMELSPPDIKGAWSGLVALVVFLLGLNIALIVLTANGWSHYFGSYWQYLRPENYSAVINKWEGTFGALFVYATIISALNFAVTYLLLSIYNLRKGRGAINPIMN